MLDVLKKMVKRDVPFRSRKRAATIQCRVVRKQAASLQMPKSARKIDTSTISVECTLEFFTAEKARCWAEVSGARVPVDLPASVLRAYRIERGMRFKWSFLKGQTPLKGRPQRIDEPVQAQADWPSEQQGEIDQLLQEAVESRKKSEWAYLNER